MEPLRNFLEGEAAARMVLTKQIPLDNTEVIRHLRREAKRQGLDLDELMELYEEAAQAELDHLCSQNGHDITVTYTDTNTKPTTPPPGVYECNRCMRKIEVKEQ